MGQLHQPAGEERGDDPGEIPAGILNSHPAAGGAGAREDLRHGEYARRGHARQNLVNKDSGERLGRRAERDAQHAHHRAHVRDHHHCLVRDVRPVVPRDDAIDDPPGEQRAQRIHRIGTAGEARHLGGREAALADDVGGQPVQHEVERVVAGKESEARAPERRLPQQHAQRRSVVGARLHRSLRQPDPRPRQEPQQRQTAEYPEGGAPAVMRHDEPAAVGADGRPEQIAAGDDAVGPAQALDGHDGGEEVRETRETRALTDAQQEAQPEQHREGVRQADQHGGAGPHREPDGKDAVRAVALGQPAGRKLQQRIGPEERGEQHPELRGGQPQLALDEGRGGGHRAAIDVVDEEGRRQEARDPPASARAPFRRGARLGQLA